MSNSRSGRSSVQRALGAIILGFETIVIFLAALVLWGLGSPAAFGLPDWVALVWGGLLIVLSLVAIVLLPSRSGVLLGWSAQIVLVLGGVLNPMVLVAGGMFGAMWWYGMRAGARLDGRDDSAHSDEPFEPLA